MISHYRLQNEAIALILKINNDQSRGFFRLHGNAIGRIFIFKSRQWDGKRCDVLSSSKRLGLDLLSIAFLLLQKIT